MVKEKCVICGNKRIGKYTIFCSDLCANRFDRLLVTVATANIVMEIINKSLSENSV